MINQKNPTRTILRSYFEASGVQEYTATMPTNVDTTYGLSNVVMTFSDQATKTLNIALNFLFEDPADSFRTDNNIIIAGGLTLDNIPINVGTVINMDYVFDTEEEYLDFTQGFYADNSLEIVYK